MIRWKKTTAKYEDSKSVWWKSITSHPRCSWCHKNMSRYRNYHREKRGTVFYWYKNQNKGKNGDTISYFLGGYFNFLKIRCFLSFYKYWHNYILFIIILMHTASYTLIVEPRRQRAEKIASGVWSVAIHSPCIISNSLSHAVHEIVSWVPLERIIFNPSIMPNGHEGNGPSDFRRLYWEAVLANWERTDMSHIFLYILARLRPDIFKKKPRFFTPFNILCDTDATNAEQDMRCAAQPLQWIAIQTRREILQKLNIDEKSPDWEKQVAHFFTQMSQKLWQ